MSTKSVPNRRNLPWGVHPKRLQSEMKIHRKNSQQICDESAGRDDNDGHEAPSLTKETFDSIYECRDEWVPCSRPTKLKIARGLYFGRGLIMKGESNLEELAERFGSERPTEPRPIVEEFSDDMTTSELIVNLKDGTTGSARGAVFMGGDFSVCTTKQALVLGAATKVHVSIREAAELGVWIYEPNGLDWRLHRKASIRVLKHLEVLFGSNPSGKHLHRENVVTKMFRDLHGGFSPNMLVLAAFETPINIGIGEEAAFVVALARALSNQRGTKESFQTLSLAAALYASWCNNVSWAPLLASSMIDDERNAVMKFDRNEDGLDQNILLELYANPNLTSKGVREAFIANLQLPENFWDVDHIKLQDAELSLWCVDKWHTPLEFLSLYSGNVRGLEKEPFHDIMLDLVEAAGSDNERAGRLMEAHQLHLELAGLVRPEVHKKLAAVNALPHVLGAKLATPRGTGAILVLTEPDKTEDLVEPMSGLAIKPLSVLRCPIKGLGAPIAGPKRPRSRR